MSQTNLLYFNTNTIIYKHESCTILKAGVNTEILGPIN